MMLDQLIWADYVILAIIGLSVLLSLWRGFVREVLSLAAWVAAFLVALLFTDQAAELLRPHVSTPSVRHILAAGGLFVVTLFAGGLVSVVVARLVRMTGLGPTDRMIGVIFGAARGFAVVVALVVLAGFVPIVQEDPWWQQSRLLPYFEPPAEWLRGYLPSDLEGTAQGLTAEL